MREMEALEIGKRARDFPIQTENLGKCSKETQWGSFGWEVLGMEKRVTT